MSNLACIEQVKEIKHKTGNESKVINIFDNYSQGSIWLDEYSDTFYDDDFELLAFVLDNSNEMGRDNIVTLIDHVIETESGISIDGTFYDWEQIQPLFDKHWME